MDWRMGGQGFRAQIDGSRVRTDGKGPRCRRRKAVQVVLAPRPCPKQLEPLTTVGTILRHVRIYILRQHADDITGLSSPSSPAPYCMKIKLVLSLLWRR